jgi:hypothetical protein
LHLAYVPHDLGRQWADGKIPDVDLFLSAAAGSGGCLFIANRRGAFAWRALKKIVAWRPPSAVCYRAAISIPMGEQFGGERCFEDEPGIFRWYGDDPESVAAWVKRMI